jgi:hypothetical protein
MNLSKNLTLEEVTRTNTGLPNVPGPAEVRALRLVAKMVFQPLRDALGVPIAVTSGYRSTRVNKAVGGSRTSAHTRGEALDLDAHVLGGTTNRAIFEWLLQNVEFDQLIWEYGDPDEPAWVHVGYRATGNRREVLKVSKLNGKTVYTKFV